MSAATHAPAPERSDAERTGEPEHRDTLLARGTDRLLDFLLVAFAAWTLIYQLCAVAGVPADWAALAGAIALVPSAWIALSGRDARRADDAPDPPRADRPRLRWLLAANVVAGLAAAILFAFTHAGWTVVWALWLVAAASAAAWCGVRLRRDPGVARRGRAGAWAEGAVVLAWAVGLAVFSLFLLGPDGDDAYYVHWIAWIAAHGEFPVRDVVYSDRIFPSLYYPPASAFEPLAGTFAHITKLATPDVVYLVVPPVASFLSVLALWRLLRTWRVPLTALALSVALAFLLLDAQDHRMPGAFFVARMWQGKVIFLCLLVPTLLVALHQYADRPSARRLVLLGAAGIAGVGLTTTGIFVVPVLAAGALAPVLLRAPRRALAAAAVTIGYPAVAAVVTLASGGRQPEVYTNADVIPRNLVHFVFGTGVLALIGACAVLIGPAALRRASAGQMVAGAALAVALLYSPPLPRAIFHLTDLGRVLWRLNWATPIAALVGALAVALVPRRWPVVLRILPAAAVCAALAVWGTPLWSPPHGETSVASKPTWKRNPKEVTASKRILAVARPGDAILAPRGTSQTLLIMSGIITTNSPRGFFTKALRGVPGAHVTARLALQHFADEGFKTPAAARRGAPQLRRALHAVGIDLACISRAHQTALRILGQVGYRPVTDAGRLRCFAPAAPGSRGGGG